MWLYDTCGYTQESFITLIVSLQCDFFHTRFLSSTQRQCLDCLTCVLLHWSSFIVLHVSSLIDNHDWMCYIVKTLLRGLSYMCPPCLTLSSTRTWRCLVNTPQSKRTHARQSKRTHVRQWRRTHVTREIKVLKSQGFKEECLINMMECHIQHSWCHIQYQRMKINNSTCPRMSTPCRGTRTQWPPPTQHPPSHAHTPPHALTMLHVLYVLHSLAEWHQYYCPSPRTTPSQQTPKQEEEGEGTRRRIVTSPRECTNETSYKRIVTSPPLNPTVSVKERAAQVCIRA